MQFMLWGKPADGRFICVFMYLFSIWGEPAGGRWMDINKQRNKETNKQTNKQFMLWREPADGPAMSFVFVNK